VRCAHLDPYLGYLHSIQFAKPSLVCDIQEVFRGLIDEFLIGYSQKLKGMTSKIRVGGCS
jgi:CRISPR/Cas system-associated endonuclease Cas1